MGETTPNGADGGLMTRLKMARRERFELPTLGSEEF